MRIQTATVVYCGRLLAFEIASTGVRPTRITRLFDGQTLAGVAGADTGVRLSRYANDVMLSGHGGNGYEALRPI